MMLRIFVIGLFLQLSWSRPSHVNSYHNKLLQSTGPHSHVVPFSASSAPVKYNVIDKSDVYTHSGIDGNGLKSSSHLNGFRSTDGIGKSYPYTPMSTYIDKVIPTTIPRTVVTNSPNSGFTSTGNVGATETLSSFQTEVITKPNFVLSPQVETIQKPEFVVQENVLGVIQKPEFVVQDVSEVLSKPEFLIQEEIVGTVVKPTFLVEEQVNMVQKPGFAIQEDVEFIVKPEFQVQEFTEVISKPTFLVEENVVPILKPTFSIQNAQEIVQKPDIVISPVPVPVRKPEYQVAENIIPITKPAFLVQETQETVIKPQFVITEEVVPVPRPNFLVEEQVQVVQRPTFQVQDVLETVPKPEYSVQDSTIIVQKPEFFIEEVTETVVKPTFVEQEVAQTVISPRYVVEDQLVPVTRPQFIVEETVVPVVKPEFFIEEVSEVIPKPEYVVEDVSVLVEKPTYVLEETSVVVQKPNYVIEETIETVSKPEYFIQEEVEVITKPEFLVQDSVVATIIKPKFVVISSSNPNGEIFDPKNYKNVVEHSSVVNNPHKPEVLDIHNVKSEIHNFEKEQKISPTYHIHHPHSPEVVDTAPRSHLTVPISQYHTPTSTPHAYAEPVVISPSLKPQIIAGIEEFTPITPCKDTTHHASYPVVHQPSINPAAHSHAILDIDVPTMVKPKFSLISSSDPVGVFSNPSKYEYHVEPSSKECSNSEQLPVFIEIHSLKPQLFETSKEFSQSRPVEHITTSHPVIYQPSITSAAQTHSTHHYKLPPPQKPTRGGRVHRRASVARTEPKQSQIVDEVYSYATPGVQPLNQDVAHFSSSIFPPNFTSDEINFKNNIHGLQLIGEKLGYQVNSEPKQFMASEPKNKKNFKSTGEEEEELFESFYGIQDLIENGQFYFDAGVTQPKCGHLYHEQETNQNAPIETEYYDST